MADYFVTYDLTNTNPSPYDEMLDQAESLGWSRWKWGPTSKKWLRLPNTTLVGDFPNHAAARKAFDDAVAETAGQIGRKVTVEKYILAAYSGGSYNSDVKADPES